MMIDKDGEFQVMRNTRIIYYPIQIIDREMISYLNKNAID